MSDGAKGGWICAALYASACAFGVFGWFGLVLLVIVASSVVLIRSINAEQGAKRAKQRPTKTRNVAAGQRCPLCHADFEVEEVAETCAGCGTLYHQGCREEWRVCATLGCRKQKRTLRSQGDLFLVARAPGPRVQAKPKVRRKICLRKDPSSGVLEVPRSEPISFDPPQRLPDPPPLPDLERRPSPAQLSRAAQRVLHRRVAS